MAEKIKLIADSTIDLSEELVKELDVHVVPLVMSFEDDEKTYRDGIDITTDDIKKHVEETGKLPLTSAVGPGVYQEIFNEYIKEGYSIIYTGIGSKLSANFQSVMIGKNTCSNSEKITLIDSNNLSSGSGLLLFKIRDLLKEGKTREEVKKICDEEITPNIRSSFCVATTDYLVKGGRCSAITGFFAKILTIKPIIKVINGKLEVGKKPIGTINTAIMTIYQDMMKVISDVDQNYLMITHFDSDPAEAYIRDIIEKTCKFKHIYATHAGCIISSHCGPGTIGLLYVLKRKEKDC